MRRLVLFLFVLATATQAFAQNRHDGDAPNAPAERAASVSHHSAPPPSADPLPVSLDRIRAALRQAPPVITTAELRYYVQVYGQSPKIELFTKSDELEHGPAPYGPPTHREFLDLWTPQEFRTPAMDMSALMRWINEQLQKH